MSVTLAKKWISGKSISLSIFEILYTFAHDFRPPKSHVYLKKEPVDKNSVTLAKKWTSGEPISLSIFEILYTFAHDFRPPKSHVCQGALGTINAT